ncbi:MAG: response regulator [Motiliproteus sp.]
MAKLNVLVVDDAAFIREMVRKTLRSRFPGMQVEDAINGRKAQQLIEKTEFDLILCDWEMPEMSGIELLTWIRQQQKSTVPFVMVTSRGDKGNVVEAIQAGVTDYMGKPFSSENLLTKVNKVLGKRHNLREFEGRPATGSGRVGEGALGAKRPPHNVTKSPSKPVAPKKTATAAKPVQSKGVAHLRFGDNTNPCQIKALSLKQIVLIAKTNDGLPTIFESVVVDLEQSEAGSNEIARINGFVHTLQANDHSISCEELTVTVNIADQDPKKLAYLSKMIAQGTTQTGYVPGA